MKIRSQKQGNTQLKRELFRHLLHSVSKEDICQLGLKLLADHETQVETNAGSSQKVENCQKQILPKLNKSIANNLKH